jgi:hypothetical protein
MEGFNMSADDNFTVALLHFEDGLKDECGTTWAGTSVVDTNQKKFGNSALHAGISNMGTLSATNDNFAFGTEDFTIDFWLYASSGTYYITSCTASGTNDPKGVSICSDGIWIGTNSSVSAVHMGSIPVNAWTHVAVVRNGTSFMVFVNGVLVEKSSVGASVSIDNKKFMIGARYTDDLNYLGSEFYMDELRISKGIARWTSNFTPPTVSYPSEVSLNPPANLTVTAGDSQVTLSWIAVNGATGYNAKRSTNAGGPYTTFASNVTGTSYIDNTVTNGTTYYYVVTAVDSNGNESANSNEASANPQAPSGHGLLRITMNDSSEREYQLSDDEINQFIEWCNRTIGTGNALYVFDKTYNIGEFKSRKEYLLFEKIISFEVMELTK